jgi:hypothetical protein
MEAASTSCSNTDSNLVRNTSFLPLDSNPRIESSMRSSRALRKEIFSNVAMEFSGCVSFENGVVVLVAVDEDGVSGCDDDDDDDDDDEDCDCNRNPNEVGEPSNTAVTRSVVNMLTDEKGCNDSRDPLAVPPPPRRPGRFNRGSELLPAGKSSATTVVLLQDG